jgi:multidrug efflux pump subunit AcrA (membrane-fusion protein)
MAKVGSAVSSGGTKAVIIAATVIIASPLIFASPLRLRLLRRRVRPDRRTGSACPGRTLACAPGVFNTSAAHKRAGRGKINVQGIRNSDDDFAGLGSGARGAVSGRSAQPYGPMADRNGHPVDPGNGQALDPGYGQAPDPGYGQAPDPGNGYARHAGNGQARDPGNGYAPSPGNGYAPSPGNGYAPSPGNGYAPSPGNGYAPSPGDGYAPSPGDGYALDRSNGYALDRSNGYALDRSNGYALDPGNGQALDPRNGQELDRGNGYAVGDSESYGALEVDDLLSTLVSEPPASVVSYPQPGEGIQVPPPGRHPVTVATGSGAKLGRRAALVALVAVVVLAAIGYALYATMQTPPLTNLSAQVVSTGQVALGFPQNGVLSAIFVRPGERVGAGQMLATELVAGLKQQVTADRDAVQTDQLAVRQLEALLTDADHEATASTSSQQQVAASGVSSAAAAIGSTLPARQSAISAFQAEVNIANQTLQTDESNYAKTCASSPTGGANCETLAHEVAVDKLSVSSAQANLSAQQAAQADWEAEANRLLANQQATQAGLNGNTTLALAPLDVDLANAKSQLVRDQAQLATDQAKQAEGELQAPQGGTVLSVDGAPGEVVSGSGVAGGNATGGSVTVTPGFELFPSQQTNAGSQASSSPVVVLEVGGPLLANVVVPESQIGLVHVGAPVTIKPKVAGPPTTTGVVTQIFPSSIVAAGVVSYEVQVKVSSPAGMRGWLPGMTATATISR